jgi:hypothetical protein
MARILGRLAVAHDHPGVAILWDQGAQKPLTQFPLSAVKSLLGGRREAFWWIEPCPEGWRFGEEIPVEDTDDANLS